MWVGVEIGKMVAVKSAGWGGDREDGGGEQCEVLRSFTHKKKKKNKKKKKKNNNNNNNNKIIIIK